MPAAPLAHSISALSRAADRLAAISVGGKALFAGGEATPGAYQGFQFSHAVDIYNAATGTWSTAMLSADQDATGRAGAAAVAVGDKALFAGGDPYPAGKDAVDVYDGTTDTWSVSPSKLPRFLSLASAAIANKAIFIGSGLPSQRRAYIYDASRDAWSTAPIPVHISPALGLSLGAIAIFTDLDHPKMDVYHAATRTWSSAPFPEYLIPNASFNVGSAAAMGARGIFVAPDGQHLGVFDSVAAIWSTVDVPPALVASLQSVPQIQGLLPPLATVLGSKVLFASQNSGDTTIAVYDTQTESWSTAQLSQSRELLAASAVGDQALFAGGNTDVTDVNQSGQDVNVVDIYTDLTPAPVFSGVIANHAGHTITITVNNTGDAGLPAGATVAVYASASRTLDGNSVVIGQVTLAEALAAGSSVQVSVPTSLKSLPAGQYHLVAAVDDHSGSGPTPIASQANTFKVAAHAAGSAASTSAAHPFARRAGPLHGWPVGG